MLTSKIVRFAAVALVGFACVLATEARALDNPIPVTLPAAALASTTTFTQGFLTVTAGFDGLPVPHDVTGGSCPANQTCSAYTYHFVSTGVNLSKVWLSVSSDVTIYEVSPAGSVFIMECLADKFPPNGLTACAQREVRFSPNATTFDATLVVSKSAPRVATAGAFAGFSSAFGLIQGPGVPNGAFTSVALATKELVAGGLCEANWTVLPGSPYDVTSPTPGCFTGKGAITTSTVGGESTPPLQDSGGATVTLGLHTSSCKLVGGIATCVCRGLPCP